jgi:hypothetical protein
MRPIHFFLKVQYGGTPFASLGGPLALYWGTSAVGGQIASTNYSGSFFQTNVVQNSILDFLTPSPTATALFNSSVMTNQPLCLNVAATSPATGGTGSTFTYTVVYCIDTYP